MNSSFGIQISARVDALSVAITLVASCSSTSGG